MSLRSAAPYESILTNGAIRAGLFLKPIPAFSYGFRWHLRTADLTMSNRALYAINGISIALVMAVFAVIWLS